MGLHLHSATSIKGLSWLGVEQIASFPSRIPSHTHPLPNLAAPAALNFSFISSSDPKASSIASANFPSGLPPPSADKISQKKLWFQWPPPLLRTAGLIFPALASNSSNDLFSLGVPAIALLRLST